MNRLEKQLLKLFSRKFLSTEILLCLIYMRSYTRRWHKFAACLYAPLEAQKGPKKSSHYYISTRNPEVKLTQNLLQKKLGKSLMNATEQPYLIFHNDCYNVDLSEGSTMSMK